MPTLVLSGELDSITTPAEAAMVTRQFPRAKHIVVANSFHVDAVGDTDDCAVQILRRFVTTPTRWPKHGCASRVAPVRTMGSFPRTLHAVPAGTGHGTQLARRVAPAAAATVADLIDRWWNNYSGHGFGLRGGRWSYTGDRTTVFHLHGVRLTSDLAVSGTATLAPLRQPDDRRPDRRRPRPERATPRRLGHPARGCAGHAARLVRRATADGDLPRSVRVWVTTP